MNQKFEVPYNFDQNLIDQLNSYREYIDFIYMPSYYLDGGNSRKDLILNNKVPKIWDEYLLHIKNIQQQNFNIGILLQENATMELIEKYYNLGINIFVINNDNLAQQIKEKYSDIKCILSITRILSFEELIDNDYSMYDEIVLFFNFCRQIQLLEKLPKKYKYVLILNSHCVYNCCNAHKHWQLNANSNIEYQNQINLIIDNYCAKIEREDRAFIQPQDLNYFNNYITNYKLVDRLMTTDDIIYDLNRYIKRYNKNKKNIQWYMLGGV